MIYFPTNFRPGTSLYFKEFHDPVDGKISCSFTKLYPFSEQEGKEEMHTLGYRNVSRFRCCSAIAAQFKFTLLGLLSKVRDLEGCMI